MAQVAPNLFQSLDDDYVCAFRRDSSGRVSHLFTSGTTALERVPWLLSVAVQRQVFLLCALALVLVLVGPTRRWLLPEQLRAPASWAANSFGFQLLGLASCSSFCVSRGAREQLYVRLPWPIWIVQTLGLLGLGGVAWFMARLLRLRPRAPLAWLAGVVLMLYAAWLWQWRLLGYWF